MLEERGRIARDERNPRLEWAFDEHEANHVLVQIKTRHFRFFEYIPRDDYRQSGSGRKEQVGANKEHRDCGKQLVGEVPGY